MQKFLLAGLLVFLIELSFAQNAYLSDVYISKLGDLEECVVTLPLDFDTVYVRIIADSAYTIEQKAYQKNTFYDYYGESNEFEIQKKMSQLGYNQIAYYKISDEADLSGRIYSISGVRFEHFIHINSYKDGKLAKIGNLGIDYFTLEENYHLKGKIKRIGDVNFTYYDNEVKDEAIGKVKRIGNTSFDYYGYNDRDWYKGKLKKVQRENEHFQIYVNW